MNEVTLQLERLRRHCDHASKTYDAISLLDLSTSLRLWTELHERLAKESPRFSQDLAFWTATPIKQIFKFAREKEYVFSCIPGGMRTWASDGDFGSIPDSVIKRNLGKHLLYSTRVMRHHDQSWDFESVTFISAWPGLEQPKDEWKRTRLTFRPWLSAEAVRLRYPSAKSGTMEKVGITREMVIKRVANTLGGAHPGDNAARENAFDEPVQYLMDFMIAKVPLPYFVLLGVAQKILSVADKHLDAAGQLR